MFNRMVSYVVETCVETCVRHAQLLLWTDDEPRHLTATESARTPRGRKKRSRASQRLKRSRSRSAALLLDEQQAAAEEQQAAPDDLEDEPTAVEAPPTPLRAIKEEAATPPQQAPTTPRRATPSKATTPRRRTPTTPSSGRRRQVAVVVEKQESDEGEWTTSVTTKRVSAAHVRALVKQCGIDQARRISEQRLKIAELEQSMLDILEDKEQDKEQPRFEMAAVKEEDEQPVISPGEEEKEEGQEKRDTVLASLKEQNEVLKRQLKQAGVEIVEEAVTFEEAKKRLVAAAHALMASTDLKSTLALERELGKWDEYVRSHPTHALELREERETWLAATKAANQAARLVVRGFVPPWMPRRGSNLTELCSLGASAEAAKRVLKSPALWLTRVDDPTVITRAHVADLRSRYHVSSLSLLELRAVFASLPLSGTFEFDGDGSKEQWRQQVEDRLKRLLKEHLPLNKRRPACFGKPGEWADEHEEIPDAVLQLLPFKPDDVDDMNQEAVMELPLPPASSMEAALPLPPPKGGELAAVLLPPSRPRPKARRIASPPGKKKTQPSFLDAITRRKKATTSPTSPEQQQSPEGKKSLLAAIRGARRKKTTKEEQSPEGKKSFLDAISGARRKKATSPEQQQSPEGKNSLLTAISGARRKKKTTAASPTKATSPGDENKRTASSPASPTTSPGDENTQRKKRSPAKKPAAACSTPRSTTKMPLGNNNSISSLKMKKTGTNDDSPRTALANLLKNTEHRSRRIE